MDRNKRARGYRQSEGDAGLVSVHTGDAPFLPPLSPPRKRAVNLACPTLPTQHQDDVRVSRTPLSDARISMDRHEESAPALPISAPALQGLHEPVLLQENFVAAAQSPDMSLALQRDESADDYNRVTAMELNLPKESFLPRLLRAYDSFHDRYTRMKASKVYIEAQFVEYHRSYERFQQVADGHIQTLCSENRKLRKTVDDAEKRIQWLESLLGQKDDRMVCGGSKDEVPQNSKCEADDAASPVRPPTYTTGNLGVEVAPVQVELHLVSEQVREGRGQGVTEDCSAPLDSAGNVDRERRREIDVAQSNDGPQEIVATPASEGLQIAIQDNVEPRDTVLTKGDAEPRRLDGDIYHLASSQTAVRETISTSQVPETALAEPILGSSSENARCPEISAPGDLDKAIEVCSEPAITCRSDGTGVRDLPRISVELQELHREKVDLQVSHREEVAGLLSEVDILQKVLGHFLDMIVVSDKIGRTWRDKPVLNLLHPRTGFRFSLEILKEHEVKLEWTEAVKVLEFSYRNVSLGTLIGVAPWWMKEEIVFSIDQLVNFLKKFHETVTGIPYNQRLVLDFGLKN